MNYSIKENKRWKILDSSYIHNIFNKETGLNMTWGKTKEENPDHCPFGPLILDIEVTTICKNGCPFCYKSNTANGKNMSFETFKKVLDKMPRTLTQAAFGADSGATSNPDLWKMMDYCRNHPTNPIVPNITVADITDDTADKLAKYCGAVACSRYEDKNPCYDSVKKLVDRGMTQVNIHQMISKETLNQTKETLSDSKTDPRLSGLNAIVLLSLKKKGRGTGFTPLTQDEFKELVDFAFDIGVNLGFDSCGCNKFLEAVKDRPDFERLEMMAEPCESSLFSSYIDVDAKFSPCSFCGGQGDWKQGIDVANCKDFLKDVWHNKRVKAFREKLLKCNRNCPVFEV